MLDKILILGNKLSKKQDLRLILNRISEVCLFDNELELIEINSLLSELDKIVIIVNNYNIDNISNFTIETHMCVKYEFEFDSGYFYLENIN